MSKILNSLIVIKSRQYRDGMNLYDVAPKDKIADLKVPIGNLSVLHTPLGDAIVKNNDYILKTITNDYYVIGPHLINRVKINKDLCNLLDREPRVNCYTEGMEHELVHNRFEELANVYILNGKVIKARDGYRGTVSEGIKNRSGIYIQCNDKYHKHLHIFEDKYLDDVQSFIKLCKDRHRFNLSDNITIYDTEKR